MAVSVTPLWKVGRRKNTYGHGHMAMATWPWPYGHALMAMATWPWPHGRGHMAMATWPWPYGHGHMTMALNDLLKNI